MDAPQTQDLKGEVLTDKSEPIPGAICTVTGGILPPEGVSETTSERGGFVFQGLVPGTYDLTCASVGFQPLAKGGIEITDTQAPFVQMILPAEVVVKQTIEVKEKAPTVSQQSTTQPARLAAPQLAALPLVQQKFKAALPLVPGVVRTPDGKINIKGTVETQGMLTVDSAETVDPVTGSFSIEIPIDAVQSVEVYKSAYRAEFGRFSGGLTAVETKPPSDTFHFEINDFIPTPRIKNGHMVGIADNSPRLYVTGPLFKNKLSVSESILYEFSRQPVRGLPWPNNETKTEGMNSYTSFQYIFTPQHLLTASVDIFPRRLQYADINSLVPQSASSDYDQTGFSLGLSDRYVRSSGAMLATQFQFMRFDSYAHGQGALAMLVTPDGWSGNFFNSYSRNSSQEQLRQSYQLPRKEFKGKHDLEVGWEVFHRYYAGTNRSRPVLVERADASSAERIDFTGAGNLNVADTEVAGFLQDHWAFNDHLAVDAGLRYSGQTLGEPTNFAPRAGMVYSPSESGKTILRGGFGVFFDREPLLAGDWVQNPTRVVTFFDSHGNPLGPPVPYPNSYIKVQENGTVVVPSKNRLDSTPHNLTWNGELDHQFAPSILVKLSYLSSRTYDQFVVDPRVLPAGPTLLLSNTGSARYHEFESTVRLRPMEKADVSFSYVHSISRGDLNSLTALFIPFQAPVIRPDAVAATPSNVPDRFVTWGTFKLPGQMTFGPVFDIHTGFPYSIVDALQNYVGTPMSQRFPTFASLDFRVTKDFRLSFLPGLRNHKMRLGFFAYNITDHGNPRDVYNNITSAYFGHFVGFQHRLYDASFDIVY
jgi:hypothetical protein